jgi:DNA-directed RNA polymerase I, II, and III subunit RPABC3
MTQKNILFEDNIAVTTVDKEGKVFDKVSRIEAKADDTDCKLILDINSEIYPMYKDSAYSILITKSVYADGSPSPNNFNYEMYTKKNSLVERYDYVAYGKIFKYSEENDGKVSVYISFGGLLLGITGEPTHLNGLKMDERVYLMLKKFA